MQVKVEHVPKATKPTSQSKKAKEQAANTASALADNFQLDKCNKSIMNKIVKRNSNIFKIIRTTDFQVKTEPKGRIPKLFES